MIDWNTSYQELTRGAGLGLLVVGMIYQQRTQGNSSCTVSKVATVNVATGYNELPGVARSFQELPWGSRCSLEQTGSSGKGSGHRSSIVTSGIASSEQETANCNITSHKYSFRYSWTHLKL